MAVVVAVAMLAAWALLGRRRYKWPYLDAAPGPGWNATDERCRDPLTGERARVWFHPGSGRRAYVRDDRTDS